MIKKLLIALAIVPTLTFAQETQKITNVTTGLVYSSDFHFLKDVSPTSSSEGFGYKSQYSFGYGLDIVLAFGEKFRISTGLFYNSKRFERTDYCYVCDVDYTPVSEFKANFFTIPVNAWYYFTDKRFDVFAIAGINNSFAKALREFRTTYSGEVDEFNSKDDFKKYVLGLNVGLGLNYNLTYRLSAGLNSIFTFNPSKFGLSPELNLNTLAVQTVLYYRF